MYTTLGGSEDPKPRGRGHCTKLEENEKRRDTKDKTAFRGEVPHKDNTRVSYKD